jgi:hypothetical protein
MAKPPPSAYLGAMRRAAYISLLIVIWAASMAALVLGMDSFWHPPFFPYGLFAGGYWAALSSVALAEEAAERIQGNKSRNNSLPAGLLNRYAALPAMFHQ